MEIYPNGKTPSTETLLKRMSQILNINDKIEFPFDFSERSDVNIYNYPADRIGGFAEIKHMLNVPQEIYVSEKDIKEIGAWIINMLKK